MSRIVIQMVAVVALAGCATSGTAQLPANSLVTTVAASTPGGVSAIAVETWFAFCAGVPCGEELRVRSDGWWTVTDSRGATRAGEIPEQLFSALSNSLGTPGLGDRSFRRPAQTCESISDGAEHRYEFPGQTTRIFSTCEIAVPASLTEAPLVLAYDNGSRGSH